MDLTHSEEHGESSLVSKNLLMEVNLGAALPVYSRMPKGDDKKKPHRAIVQLGEDDGSIKSLEIETRSDKGPLSPRDYSVLVALIDIACMRLNGPERESVIKGNSYRIFVRYIDICHKLDLDENSITHVKKSLQKIKSQEMKIKDFIYDAPSNSVKRVEEETNLILKIGRYLVGKKEEAENPEYVGGLYIDLDPFIVESMLKENVAIMNRNIFLDLPSGPARRIYSYLTSKRSIFGNEYTVKLSEVATLVGKEASYKSKERIQEQIHKISDASGIKFYISKDKGAMEWTILVSFSDYLALGNEDLTYFEILEREYSKNVFYKYDLDEILLENYERDLSKRYLKLTGSEYLTFRNEEIKAGEFVIDILFHLIEKNHYEIKSFKAYAGKVVDSIAEDLFELPDRYRKFVRDRFSERSKKEIDLKLKKEEQRTQKIQQQEEERLLNNFDRFFESYVKTNAKLYNELVETVEDTLRRTCSQCYHEHIGLVDYCECCESQNFITEYAMMYTLELGNRVKALAFELFQEGELQSYISDQKLSDRNTKDITSGNKRIGRQTFFLE